MQAFRLSLVPGLEPEKQEEEVKLDLLEDEIMEIFTFADVYKIRDHEQMVIPTPTLGLLLADMGFSLTEAELNELEIKADEYNEGVIPIRHLLVVCEKLFQRSRITEDNAEEVFHVFDDDHDGLISADDVKRILHGFGDILPDQYITKMVREADIDGDGLISFDEFLYLMTGTA